MEYLLFILSLLIIFDIILFILFRRDINKISKSDKDREIIMFSYIIINLIIKYIVFNNYLVMLISFIINLIVFYFPMKKTGYSYKTYWCESEECYFKIKTSDKIARNSSQLEAIYDNQRELQYPTYLCGDIDIEDYINEDDEIDFQTLKINSKEYE
jgi:hypothetical protein